MAYILLAEDSRPQGMLTRRLLEDAGHEVGVFADGKLALDEITREGARHPDLVVTDLDMPEMDGLELVRALHEARPSLPVVLLTARGSEETAVEALKEGASSYVPKRIQEDELTHVVGELLELAQADRDQQEMLSCITGMGLRFVLPNDPSLISPLVSHVEGQLKRMRFLGESDAHRVGVALREALVNALYHGNLEVSSAEREGQHASFLETGARRAKEEPYRDRRVTFEMSVEGDAAKFVVADEGPGFKLEELPDPFDPENLERASGRGILLIRTFMDDVTFNDRANRITMIKRKTG